MVTIAKKYQEKTQGGLIMETKMLIADFTVDGWFVQLCNALYLPSSLSLPQFITQL